MKLATCRWCKKPVDRLCAVPQERSVGGFDGCRTTEVWYHKVCLDEKERMRKTHYCDKCHSTGARVIVASAFDFDETTEDTLVDLTSECCVCAKCLRPTIATLMETEEREYTIEEIAEYLGS